MQPLHTGWRHYTLREPTIAASIDCHHRSSAIQQRSHVVQRRTPSQRYRGNISHLQPADTEGDTNRINNASCNQRVP